MNIFDLGLAEDPIGPRTDDEYLKQQIDILFETRFGDLFGDAGYGTDYRRFLYELKASNDAMRIQMENDLYNLDLRGYVPSVDVYFLNGTKRDIAVIDVQLVKNDRGVRVLYKIT